MTDREPCCHQGINGQTSPTPRERELLIDQLGVIRARIDRAAERAREREQQ